MKIFQRWVGLVVVGLALGTTVGATEKWIHAQTEHFDMYSAGSERESRRFLNELEQFQTAFQKLFGFSSVGQPRIIVMMFDSKSQLDPFRPEYKGKAKDVAGYYLKRSDEDIIVLTVEAQDRGDESGYSVIFHEYVHKLLHEQGYTPPTWLDEGLAQFYATMRVDQDSVEIGHPAERRLREIAHNAILPLDKLFAVTHASPEYNEAQQMGVFYAESWLLVHYLTCGTDKSVQGKFVQFLEGVDDLPEEREARFRQVYGRSYGEMEIALRSYLNGGQFRLRSVHLPIGDFSDKIHFKPASEVECDTALEDLRWRVRPGEGSPLRMMQLAERDPKSARPYEVLAAYTLNKDHDRRQAQVYWEKAVERGSTNAYIYLQLAQAQLRYITSKPSLDFQAPSTVAEPIRKYLDRAVELRPDYLEAWEALAQIEAFSEKPRVAVLSQVQKVVPTMRSKANTLAALAVVRWRMGDLKTCQEILAALENCNLAHTNVPIIMKRLNERIARAARTENGGVDDVSTVLTPIDRP